MRENRIKGEALISNLQSFVDFALSAAEKGGIDKKIFPEINLIVEEVFVNIAQYAYNSGAEEKTVFLECKILENNRFFLAFEDYGTAFDARSVENPDLSSSLENKQIGGFGVHLVKEICESVKYIRYKGKNRLELITG